MKTRREFLAQATAVTAAASIAAGSPHVDARTRKGPLRLGLVGTGQISPRYLSQAKGNERARFVATCARTLESAKARAVEYGIEASFDNYITMFDKVKPDGIVVATPTPTHKEITVAALERGIHVLCEKPMAMNFEDCQAMAAAAQKSGAVLLVLPYEGSTQTRTVLNYLNDETLGVFVGAHSDMMAPGMSRNDWYYDGKVAGPAFGEMFVYPVSTLVSLLGPARRVTGFINILIPHRIIGNGPWVDYVPPPRDPTKGRIVNSTAAENATLVLEWANGQQAVARGMWGTSIISASTRIYGRHGTLWIEMKDFKSNELIIHSPEKVIAGAVPVSGSCYHENCYRVPVPESKNEGLVDHFIDCILGLAKPTCGPEQALHVHEILYKGDEASRSGQTQELKTTFTLWHGIEPVFMDTRSRPV